MMQFNSMEVCAAGMHTQVGGGGRLGNSDAHHDGRFGRAYLRRLYPHENTLISLGIKY